MATSVPRKLDEGVPARIVRHGGPDGDTTVCALTARRYLGVLVHPVDAATMAEHTGDFEPGARIIVDWPEEERSRCSLRAGDEIEVQEHHFAIRAVDELPLHFAEIYVDA